MVIPEDGQCNGPARPGKFDLVAGPMQFAGRSELLRYLRPGGRVFFFGKNPSSYLNIKRRSGCFRPHPASTIRWLHRNGLRRQLVLTLDAQGKQVFFPNRFVDHRRPPLRGGKAAIREWLFNQAWFQGFMPYWGVFAGAFPLADCVLSRVIERVVGITADSILEKCYFSKTGVLLLVFETAVARIGLDVTGNFRVANNVRNLERVRVLARQGQMPDDGSIPRIRLSECIGDCRLSLETRVDGHDAEALLADVVCRQMLTRKAAAYLEALTVPARVTVSVDAALMDRLVLAPIRRIAAFMNMDVERLWPPDIRSSLLAPLESIELPLVFRHGDFKFENIAFSAKLDRISGVFDWDMAAFAQLPFFDIYKLMLYNEAVVRNTDMIDAIKAKLFPMRMDSWEVTLLKNYFGALGVPFQSERFFAFLFFISLIDSTVVHGNRDFVGFRWRPEHIDDIVANLRAELDR